MKFTQWLESKSTIAPIDTEEYGPLEGLEGPFRFRSGAILYYDTAAGKYYDRKTDLYIDDNEMMHHLHGR